jgi:nucleotide-binding universal stress UspA family protein
MYNRILVATGGSPWSNAAVTYAIAMAARMDAELHILTVLSNFGSYSSPDMIGGSELVMDLVERQGQEFLNQAAARATSAGVVHRSHSTWGGNVPEAVLQTAAETHCDLIILGSRGSVGWKRLMLGSISNAVAAKAQQPVLVIKSPPAASSDAPLWHRILVATGGSPWSDMAVDHAVTLAQKQHLEMCFLHVDRQRPQRGEDPAACEGKNILALAEVHAAANGITYDATLAYGDVTTAILETATRKQCDAIVLGSRGLTGWKRLMLGSISNTVAAKAPLPVLIVKRFLAS